MIIHCAPKSKKVSLISFAVYVYTGDDHILTPERAFVCLALFDILRTPLTFLPMIIVSVVQVN